MLALGNTAPIERVLTDSDTGAHEDRPLTGPRTTFYGPPGEWGLLEKLQSLVGGNGAWEWHSTEPPAWVDGDEPVLVAAVAEHYGCPTGRPEGWLDTPDEVVPAVEVAPEAPTEVSA